MNGNGPELHGQVGGSAVADGLPVLLDHIAANASSRIEVCIEFINRMRIQCFAEIGVYRGVFAEQVLRNCPTIERYYMVDPWRHLEDWNKPANVSDREFDRIYQEAMDRTEFAAARRIVLRAKTTDAMRRIAADELDAVYIDGDHTLKGITIDLISMYDKVRPNGFIIGDDFAPTVWQHSREFEPTFVFPLAVYFAEAKEDTIYGLPFNQFLIVKAADGARFRFRDVTGRYEDTSLRKQLLAGPKGRTRKFLDRVRSALARMHPARSADASRTSRSAARAGNLRGEP